MIEQRVFVLRHTVTFEDTNVVGNVYFANYVRWQGHCRETFLHENAPEVIRDLSDGLRIMTVRCSCEFYAELNAFDELEIRMRLEWQQQNRVSLSFDYVCISRGGEELVARGSQEVAFMRVSGGTSAATHPPHSLLRALTAYA